MRESAVTNHILLAASQLGLFPMRNNSGGFYDERGRFVRYGLGSFCDKDQMKSSDFIFPVPTLIMPHHVGTFLGVFTALETKPSDWVFNSSDKRSLHQKNFHDMIIQAGGNAGFAPNVNEFRKIIKYDTR